ncbi:hypothetical protein JW962_02410 [Candidatus Dojkabacteria bacterium]|nr:hypothetical protein [Candidatus Dojkabacteria bacterium]
MTHLQQDPDFLTELTPLIKANSTHFLIDEFVHIEYVRDTFLPMILKTKEDFIKEVPFIKTILHPDILKKKLKNVITLTQMYIHFHKSDKNSVGLGDLLLGAAHMLYSQTTTIITSDKTHFCAPIFETTGILVPTASKRASVDVYFIVRFSETSYKSFLTALEKCSQNK